MTAADGVRGSVAPGFEPVARELAGLVERGDECGAALCVHLDGREVVHLWAGRAGPDRAWRESTACCYFSATKGLTALCVQLLVERGRLGTDDPVALHWPEFAAAGKETVLVRHLLAHTAGVLTFPRYWEDVSASGRELADWGLITSRLAAAPAAWRPGTAFRYSPLVFGYLVGELIRRVDGRSPGRFLVEEVADPLRAELRLGLPDHATERSAAVIPEDPDEQPRLARLQARADARARELIGARRELEPAAADYAGLFVPPGAPTSQGRLHALMSHPAVRAAELPACGAFGTAHALSRVYAALSLGGTLDGVRLVSADSLEHFTREQTTEDGRPTGFGLGYARLPMPTLAGPGQLRVRPGKETFGHSGAGGALGFADPEHRLAFGYVKNRMLRLPTPTYDLVRAVYRCL